MEGWVASGADFEAPGGSGSDEPWSITRSQDLAYDGYTSLKLVLGNINDGGKIFIEKPFEVEPNQIYQVRVEFAFGSGDWGTANLWQIVAGAVTKPPENGGDVVPAIKDETGNGNDYDVGYVWLNKSYEVLVRTQSDAVYVFIGVWGTYEVGRIYYLDNVRVTLTKKSEGCEFYSFEKDFEGWLLQATDLEFNRGSVDWSITRTDQLWEDGRNSLRFDLNSLNSRAKIWIERPFIVEPGRKYKVALDYAFHTRDWGDIRRFRIITGVFRSPPQTADDLTDSFQGDTTSTGGTWGWLHKSYAFTIKSKKSNALYLVIGIWGNREDHHTYGLDSVCVSLAAK